MRFTLIILLSIFISCGSNGIESTSGGRLYLEFKEKNDFNPNADPGIIDYFKVTLNSSHLDNPVIKTYSSDTKSIEFDELPSNAQVKITVEAFNQNGFVIRRGYSSEILIKKNEAVPAEVQIYNVPVFTNVKPNAYINVNRFVPRIFAPGEINFQLSDTFESVTTSLSDNLTGEFNLSISDDQFLNSTRPVYINELLIGDHTLTVEDPETLESTKIEVTGYESPTNKVLTTTAGGYLGVLSGIGAPSSHMGRYLQIMQGME